MTITWIWSNFSSLAVSLIYKKTIKKYKNVLYVCGVFLFSFFRVFEARLIFEKRVRKRENRVFDKSIPFFRLIRESQGYDKVLKKLKVKASSFILGIMKLLFTGCWDNCTKNHPKELWATKRWSFVYVDTCLCWYGGSIVWKSKQPLWSKGTNKKRTAIKRLTNTQWKGQKLGERSDLLWEQGLRFLY